MKVEGGAASTATPHKVKVKEEAKECCSFQQSTPSCTSTATTTIANIIIPTTTVTTTTTTIAAAASTTTATTIALTTTSATLSASLQPSTIICHPPTLTSSANNNQEPFSADHEVQCKGKVSNPTCPSREKSREENSENAREARLSPSSQLQRSGLQITNGSRFEYKNVESRTFDNDSPLPTQSLKLENDDGGCRQDDTQPVDGNGVLVSNGSARGISGIIRGHGKLKRLLGTLVQFATDISPDTGDTVRALVLGLLSGSMTAEEFHTALQEATNFPLRGFVLPYLKHTLPFLQRDLNGAARASNQTCVQYLRSNESAVLEAVGFAPSGESVELFGDHGIGGGGIGNSSNSCSMHYGLRSNSSSNVGAIQHTNNVGTLHHYSGTNHAPKRRASDTPYFENGAGPLFDDGPVYGKRSTSMWSHHHQQHQIDAATYSWYHPVHSSGGSTIQNHAHGHGSSSIPPNLVQVNQFGSFGPHHVPQQQQTGHGGQLQNGSSTLDDEWKNIYVMLNCILGMVEKTKRALAILQRRGCSSPAAVTPLAAGGVATQNGNSGNGSSVANGSQADSSGNDRDSSLKRLSGEIVAQTIRATEDRVAEVKRRAEEAVQEVKRAAVAEVQRAVAVAVAESRATERLRVHRLLDLPLPHRNHRQDSFLHVPSHGTSITTEASTRCTATPTTTTTSTTTTTTTTVPLTPSIGEGEKESHVTSIMGPSCWNCGRPALETCGGCGVARYCGSFCQHRDWEAGGHHATCNNSPSRDSLRSTSRSPSACAVTGTGIVTGSGIDNDTSAAITASATVVKGK